jgi:hypothetical protein
MTRARKVLDVTGQTFGRWTVLERILGQDGRAIGASASAEPKRSSDTTTCAAAQRLRAQGLTLRAIAGLMGGSPRTVGDWLNDPDGSRMKARKERYRGTCVDCGGPTTGGLGRGPNAPLRCRRCWGKETAKRTRQRARDRFELELLERRPPDPHAPADTDGRQRSRIDELCGLPGYANYIPPEFAGSRNLL